MSCRVQFRYEALPGTRPTIYTALKAKLGREPTQDELIDDVRRILDDAHCALADAGKIKYQRKR